MAPREPHLSLAANAAIQLSLLALPNVIATPHALGWTDECFAGMGQSACAGIVAVANGQTPKHVINRAVTERPRAHEKLRRYAAGNDPSGDR